MPSQPDNLFERAFKKLLAGGTDAFSGWRLNQGGLTISADLNEQDLTVVTEWVDHCLAENGGQVLARKRAAELGRAYLTLSSKGRMRFLCLLAEHYGIDEDAVSRAMEDWRNAEPDQRNVKVQQLRKSLEPSRTTLLKQFNGVPSGVKFLVDMREELLSLVEEQPLLMPLEQDLKELLEHWFDIGLLQLEEISWKSSAVLLEKLIAYEAVHEIKSWNDLKNRLDSDRRCFAFIHPNMPDEPLIFVEVALVNGLAGNVQKLLDEDAPTQDIDHADTAIFYSISNAQQGLAGISFGNFLIKQVVARLKEEFPHLKQFATLSPIPGFCRWLDCASDEEIAELPGGEAWLNIPQPRLTAVADSLANKSEPEKQTVLRLAAAYLCLVKRESTRAKDPVANFHLSNGAQVAQLNWLADSSDKGLKQAAGLMVNYLYDLPNIDQRSEQYTASGEIAKSAEIRKLIK